MLLEHYLGRQASIVALCLLYAAIILACTMLLGRLAPEPMIYLDMR
jgi:hypothetical protein